IRQLAIMKEHCRIMNDISRDITSEKHYYFIHDARVIWHKGLRNSLYHLIDQQFVRHFYRKSKKRLILETIRQMTLSVTRPATPGTVSPSSPGTLKQEDPKKYLHGSVEDVKQMYDSLMQRTSM